VNLLFDCHTFDAGPQGTTTFLAGLLNALPEAAQTLERPLSLTCAAKDPGSVARFINVPHQYEQITGGFASRNLVELPRLTRTRPVDVVVSQYVRPFRSRVATVSVIHDVLFLDFTTLFGWRYRMLRQILFGWAARHSDVVITVSSYSRDRIAHHFGIPPERIDVLPNAVNVTAPLPPAVLPRAAGQPLRLLYVSRFETRKRQHWCVAAAQALASRGHQVELTLVGHAEGAYADAVMVGIAAREISGAQVSIRSNVSQSDLEAMYGATDLFLFPSQCEGFGIPVIEAAAYGIPCVVAANTAMRELAGHYAGIGVEAGEADFVDAVMDAVDRLPQLRQEALARAPGTRDAYRWSDVAREFAAILDRRGVFA